MAYYDNLFPDFNLPQNATKKQRVGFVDRIADAGADYGMYGIGREDKKKALFEALASVGEQLLVASQGGWGDLAVGFGSAVGAGAKTYKGSLDDTSRRRMAEDEFRTQQESRKKDMRIKDQTIAAEDDRVRRETETRQGFLQSYQKMLPEIEADVNNIIANDPDIASNPAKAREWKSRLAIAKSNLASRRDDPEAWKEFDTLLGQIYMDAGEDEAYQEKRARFLDQTALEAGFVDDQGNPDISRFTGFKEEERNLDIEGKKVNIDAGRANIRQSNALTNLYDRKPGTTTGTDPGLTEAGYEERIGALTRPYRDMLEKIRPYMVDPTPEGFKEIMPDLMALGIVDPGEEEMSEESWDGLIKMYDPAVLKQFVEQKFGPGLRMKGQGGQAAQPVPMTPDDLQMAERARAIGVSEQEINQLLSLGMLDEYLAANE